MKRFSQFIQRTGSLDRLQHSARVLAKVEKAVRHALPVEAAGHLTGCALRADALVVFADSAGWASQLRYLESAILKAARSACGPGVQRVSIKVLPVPASAGKPPAPELTENSRRLLEQTASGIRDNDLAEALRRLSSNAPDQDAD